MDAASTLSPGMEWEWDEWVSLFATRDELSREYLGHAPEAYSALNAAILRRWSPAGLRYIKEKAWKLVATA